MKILKIFGLVVGIHLFALLLIFANPGCSSSTKRPMPRPADTEPIMTAAPASSAAASTSSPYYTSGSDYTPATPPSVVSFDPNAPAVAAPGGRSTPTRPGSPAASAVAPEPVPDVVPATTYTVKAGDSLWTISRRHGVTVAQIASANSLNTQSPLRPGQKLVIPQKSGTTAAATNSAPAPKAASSSGSAPRSSGGSGTMKHIVKSGESLSVIARNYGVRAGDIAVANRISDPAKIQAGMELVIPGWEATSARKGGSTRTPSTPPAATAPVSEPAPEPEPAAPLPTTPLIEPAPEPAPSTSVPLIQIEESPVAPAPKER